MADFGYAGEILKVDLSNRKITREPTSNYAGKYLGGRGFATRLFWDMVSPQAKALEPENTFLAVTGPTTGFVGVAGCRFQVCGKTPENDPEAFSYGNLGGRWGMALKAAGFDALAIQGKSEKPVYLFLQDGAVEIRDASAIWGKSTYDTLDILKVDLGNNISTLTTGPAGENQVVFATVNSDGSASGGGGLGSVMGSKKIKAIVAVDNRRLTPAQPERLQKLIDQIKTLRRSAFGRASPWTIPGVTTDEECYGCGIGCMRQVYTGDKGRYYKSFCQATNAYKELSRKYNKDWNEAELIGERLVDTYSLDTGVMAPLGLWLDNCHKEGLITEKETGLPFSKIGQPEFIEALTRKIAYREGFGDLLAQGAARAAKAIGGNALEILHRYVATRTNECPDYDPRLFITTALLYATEPRRPIQQLHGVSIPIMGWLPFARKDPNAFVTTSDIREGARRYWGSAVAADFSTYQGKALAAKKIQDRVYAKESLILCDLMWPMMSVNRPEDHVGDPTMENQIYSAITGKETDEAGLARFGERICNLERAIQIRHGWQGRKDDIIMDRFHDQPLKKGDIFFNPDAYMPGPNGEITSRIGSVLERSRFEDLKDEYYTLRGWDLKTGYPTITKLTELGLSDIAADLKKSGLAI
jgi:aldehyde:ferredoxin oxidoreductase